MQNLGAAWERSRAIVACQIKVRIFVSWLRIELHVVSIGHRDAGSAMCPGEFEAIFHSVHTPIAIAFVYATFRISFCLQRHIRMYSGLVCASLGEMVLDRVVDWTRVVAAPNWRWAAKYENGTLKRHNPYDRRIGTIDSDNNNNKRALLSSFTDLLPGINHMFMSISIPFVEHLHLNADAYAYIHFHIHIYT